MPADGRRPGGAGGPAGGRRPPSLKVRALQWLAQREHSPAELRARLLRAAQAPRVWTGASPGGIDAADTGEHFDADRAEPDRTDDAVAAEVDALLAWLSAHGYLSAERFVESRVHARQARFGQQRISQELRSHGLALDPAARQALQATEYERAHELWRRKFDGPASDAAGRLRQMRFLAGRGFSHDVVRRLVRGEGDGPSDD